ncbi:hypothetical protein [Streptacidiphilus sp. EB103A]|uniref:hypothetical protein n=1 Tax=Streptacidiphilus sp. EB103A TaxID=3156275 RepID=UPI0035193DE6
MTISVSPSVLLPPVPDTSADECGDDWIDRLPGTGWTEIALLSDVHVGLWPFEVVALHTDAERDRYGLAVYRMHDASVEVRAFPDARARNTALLAYASPQGADPLRGDDGQGSADRTNAAVRWRRPQFRGREGELVHLAQAARLVGVSRAAVSQWAKRHDAFPELALEAGSPARPTKFVVREEFLAFARVQLAPDSRRTGPRSPNRPAAVVAAEQLATLQRRIERLAARRQALAVQLRATDGLLRAAQRELKDAADQWA